MGRQGRDHCARTDLWHLNMVAVLSHTVYQSNIDMGFEPKAPAHFGRIQHHLGMDFLYGTCSKPC